ncbi:MAG: rhomboid family intramembrane serine protease [Halobacteriovoraceae bacterium]|nr:rhomboid family intramembrane serine protease [Halobacteriovoraceae bacterium]
MEIIKELKSTYLSKSHYKGAKLGALLFLTVCALFSSFYWNHELGDILLAKGTLIFGKGDYYRLLTSLFIHGDLKHLLSNSLMLLVLSYFVIEYYSLKTFALYSLSAGVLTNVITILFMKPEIGLLGASGVVYFLWSLWLTLYVLIQRTVPLSRRIMKVTAVTLFLLVPSSFDPQVSYMAHGVGFAVGIIFGMTHFFFFRKKIRSFEKYKYTVEYDDEDYLYEDLSYLSIGQTTYPQ